MHNAVPKPWTVDEFLTWERAQEERYEFVDGVIHMMTGGTLDHATIKGNVYAALRQALRGTPCRVFVEGPKVVAAGAATYPDVVVTCSERVAPKDDTVHEPALIVEVLSRSTEGWDRGGKWRAYQELPGLRRYVLISQDERRVESYAREEGSGWRFAAVTGDGSLPLPEFGAALPLDEVYERTSLDPRRTG
jgi:Uma2 family endonuclease